MKKQLKPRPRKIGEAQQYEMYLDGQAPLWTKDGRPRNRAAKEVLRELNQGQTGLMAGFDAQPKTTERNPA